MKISELKLLIREIVREEISLEIKKINQSKPKDSVPMIQETQKKVSIKTGNPIIDEVISNTKVDSSFNGYGSPFQMDNPMSSINETVSDVGTGTEIPSFLQKDFKTLLKKTAEKVKIQRGGNGPL